MQINHDDALYADLYACQQFKTGPEAAASVGVPTLCVLAKADRMTPVKKGRELAAAIAGATLVELNDTGHMIPAEHPQELNRQISAFLKS